MEGWRKLVGSRLKTQPAGPHPNPGLLAAFAENALTGGEQESLLRHLADCPDCREILYLSIPEGSQVPTAIPLRPARYRFVLRWGTVAASLVIVGAVLNSHYFSHKASVPQVSEVAEVKVPAEGAPIVAEGAPIVRDEEMRAQAGNDLGSKKTRGGVARDVAKVHPSAKAMTGKPVGKMEFDQSGEVHMAAAPAPQAAANADKDLRVANENALDDSLQANTKELPRALSKSGTVGGVTSVQTEREYDRDRLNKKQADAESAPVSSLTYAASNGAMQTLVPRWTVSAQGGIQRSFDLGKTWQPVPVAQGIVFRALSIFGTDVWAGGSSGALYHSQDSGSAWVRVEPKAAGQKLETDITRIEFPDALHGTVNTASGETWTTSDRGATWSRK